MYMVCGGWKMLGPWEVSLLGGVALLEKACHCGGGALRSHIYAEVCPVWCSPFSWLPLDQDVELSDPPAPCLPRCCHALTMMIMDWTSETVSQPQLNVVLMRVALVMVSVHSSKTLRHIGTGDLNSDSLACTVSLLVPAVSTIQLKAILESLN